VTTATIKGQFVKGKQQRIKKPSENKLCLFDDSMPRIDTQITKEHFLLTQKLQGVI